MWQEEESEEKGPRGTIGGHWAKIVLPLELQFFSF